MRLTLRTMLAYMDEILDPADQEEIGRKIEESEFASDLVRRTRDVVGRLRLGAPQITGLGEEIDANSVADYLDNAMPAAHVPDFERACLDSDVALAEVAACHQILTLVLGQPAEVAPAARERMYRIPATLTGEPTFEDGAIGPAVADEVPADEVLGSTEPADTTPKPARSKPEIPDYLREQGGPSWRRVLTGAVAVLVLAGAALVAFGPRQFRDRLVGQAQVAEGNGQRQPLGASDPKAAVAKIVTDEGDRSAHGSDEQPVAAASQVAAEDAAAAPSDGEPSDGDSRSEGAVESPEGAPKPSLANPEVVADSASDSAPTPPEPNDVLVDRTESDTAAIDAAKESTEVPADETPGETAAETAAAAIGTVKVPSPEAVPPTEAAGSTDIADKLAAATTDPGRADVPSPLPVEPLPDGAQGVEVAVYSNKDLLLRYDREAATWRHLPLRSPIRDHDRLLALPTFRPTVLVGAGISLELNGGTSVEFRHAGKEGPIRLAVRYGRLLVITAGGSDNRLRIDLDDDTVEFDLDGNAATLALELTREMPPGINPEDAPAPLVTRLLATSGKIVVKIGDREEKLEAPAGVEVSSGQVRVMAPPPELPEWVDADGLGRIDRRASNTLGEELSLDRPAGLVLQELVEGQRSGRRSEVRSLAARCSIYVGRFEPFVEALNDAQLKAAWRPQLIKALREALALGPDVAADVRRDFRKRRGNEAGDALFRMLWGYSPQDLEQGADRELVDYLEHEQLDFRLLSLWNLVQITGLGQNSRLEDPKENRWQVARRWKKRFEDNQIVPKAQTP